MNPILQIARTELLEHRRQPWMVVIQVLNYLVWVVGFGFLFAWLDTSSRDPAFAAQVQALIGMSPAALAGTAASTYGSMLFTNLPLYVAVLSGYSVLNDRAHGTLPYLMLAPVTRRQLLLGKLLGAMALPLLLHLVLVPLSSLPFSTLPVLQERTAQLGQSGAWWVSLAVGAPATATLVGALGTLISGLSRDVRTSMQFTSFFIGILSLGFGYVLVDGLAWGVPLQLAFAAGCVGVGLGILVAGAAVISRDIEGA